MPAFAKPMDQGDFLDGQNVARISALETRVTGIENKFDILTKRITVVGSMLAGAFLASGLLDGRAVAVIKAILINN